MPGSNIFPEKTERLVCDFLNQKVKWKIEEKGRVSNAKH